MIYQATHDPLTGLQNRKGFVETLQSEMQRTSQDDTLLALLYIDLDGFKQINDNFGHNYGDELLKDFAKKLSLCVRGGDTLTRIGGDEFTVIIKNVDHVDKVVDIAERIMKICDEPFRNNGTNSTYSLSMGIAFYPFEDVDAETLIHHADAAMYAVKDKSRNDYLFYSSELNRERQRRTTFEDQLALALSENQFQLVYQPKINIINSTMVGMEALLRWTHPVHGPVSPVDFIPMLEDSGKIVEVGEWVMRKACATTRCWHQAGMDHLVIAVNVSPVQFQHVNFLDTVKKVLDEEQFPAECLEIEVTEGCLMEDIKQCVHKLNALRDLGVRIAVDDFGTGYSSLSYLQQFPINTLKIDRSFVSKLYESRDNASIVTAIMALAHSMRLEVVAEGVEEPQELAYLSALGCQVIQGYLFSRPLPENEIRQFHIDEKVVHDKMRPMQNADLEVNTA
jgi:diguanylate cyclase (GGDEF)-like protein